jgi:hypothetical protein
MIWKVTFGSLSAKSRYEEALPHHDEAVFCAGGRIQTGSVGLLADDERVDRHFESEAGFLLFVLHAQEHVL